VYCSTAARNAARVTARVVGVDHDADELADPAQFFNARGNPPGASADRTLSLRASGVNWVSVAGGHTMRLFLIVLGIALSLVFFFAVILPAARQAEKEPLWTTLRPTQAGKFDVDAFILRWDVNRDGMINRDELGRSVGNRFEGLVDKLFAAFDKNQDGRLSRAELNNLARESFFWMFEAPQRPES